MGSVAARVIGSGSFTVESLELTRLHSANSGEVGVGGRDTVVVAELL